MAANVVLPPGDEGLRDGALPALLAVLASAGAGGLGLSQQHGSDFRIRSDSHQGQRERCGARITAGQPFVGVDLDLRKSAEAP